MMCMGTSSIRFFFGELMLHHTGKPLDRLERERGGSEDREVREMKAKRRIEKEDEERWQQTRSQCALVINTIDEARPFC